MVRGDADKSDGASWLTIEGAETNFKLMFPP